MKGKLVGAGETLDVTRIPAGTASWHEVVVTSADGGVSEAVPVLVLTVSRPRPCLALVAGVHGAMADGVLTPWIEFLNEPGPVGQAAFAAASASGFPDLVGLSQELPRRLLTAFAARGVSVIEGEVGGRGQLRRENVATYKQRALAVAGYRGILPNPSAAAADRPAVWSLAERHVVAPVTGLFEPDVSLKQLVRAGTRVGQILDARGDRSAELRTETDAVVAGYRDHAGVQKGDTLVTL